MCNILLIDDETVCGDIARANVKHEFEAAELEQVLDCCSGLKALEKLKYDALILDINLKCEDGLGCLRQIRGAWPSLPVVVITDPWTEEQREECLAAGADYYVIKGSIDFVLGLAVRTAMDKRQATLNGEHFIEDRRKKISDIQEKTGQAQLKRA